MGGRLILLASVFTVTGWFRLSVSVAVAGIVSCWRKCWCWVLLLSMLLLVLVLVLFDPCQYSCSANGRTWRTLAFNLRVPVRSYPSGHTTQSSVPEAEPLATEKKIKTIANSGGKELCRKTICVVLVLFSVDRLVSLCSLWCVYIKRVIFFFKLCFFYIFGSVFQSFRENSRSS